jgi:hypothetical protein
MTIRSQSDVIHDVRQALKHIEEIIVDDPTLPVDPKFGLGPFHRAEAYWDIWVALRLYLHGNRLPPSKIEKQSEQIARHCHAILELLGIDAEDASSKMSSAGSDKPEPLLPPEFMLLNTGELMAVDPYDYPSVLGFITKELHEGQEDTWPKSGMQNLENIMQSITKLHIAAQSARNRALATKSWGKGGSRRKENELLRFVTTLLYIRLIGLTGEKNVSFDADTERASPGFLFIRDMLNAFGWKLSSSAVREHIRIARQKPHPLLAETFAKYEAWLHQRRTTR